MTISPNIQQELATGAADLAATAAPTKDTGIRLSNCGEWVAVRNGRYVGSFKGIGAKRSAILAAQSNRVIA